MSRSQYFRNNVMIKRRKEKEKVKKDFAESGAFANMRDELKKKREGKIKAEELPF